MNYDIELFIRIINFIVAHDDEPELFLELNDGTLIEFTCYRDFIDVSVDEDYDTVLKFKDISDFLENLKINGVSLKQLWKQVRYIYDDQTIDYSKEPEDQFQILDGHICYTPKPQDPLD